MALHLDQLGSLPPPPHNLYLYCNNKKYFSFKGEPMTRWRDYIQDVQNSINRFKKPMEKSRLLNLIKFFTRANIHLPNLPQFFNFSVNENVRVDLSTRIRKQMTYKWSLYPGVCIHIYISTQ